MRQDKKSGIIMNNLMAFNVMEKSLLNEVKKAKKMFKIVNRMKLFVST